MSIVKNSFYVSLGIFVMAILNYIFHIYVGRSLGPADYGVFGALMALFLIVALPAGALGSAITKFTSKYNAKKQYSKISALRKEVQSKVLIFGAIMLLFIIMFSQYIASYLKIDSNVPVIFVGLTLIFALILPINRGILQGMKKFKVYSWNSIIESASRLLLVIVLLSFGLGVDGAVLAYGLAYFVAFLSVFPFIKEIKQTTKEKIDMKPVYKFIFLVLFVNLIIQLLINAPTLFIKHYLSAEFTGYWTAALNLARISLFVTGGISLVMFPEVSGERNHENKESIFRKSLILTLITSLGIALVFLIIPSLLIKLLYGPSYLGAVPILEWMGFAMIFIGLIQLRVNYWLARR
jgi:O-antigen/teichoic acid export membrane protein